MLAGASSVLIDIVAVADALKPEEREAIVKQHGTDRFIAEGLPSDKADVIMDLQKQATLVAMVGDGVNDAPVMAAADVAKETGGIIPVKDDCATMGGIKQNLFWANIYNTIGVPAAASGFLNPIIAAAAISLSSRSVIVNSALLKRMKPEKP